jgi:hypothetical protein
MQPASAEWYAGFDHPGAELVEKFAIVGDKAALLRQPFRKGEPLDPLKRTFAGTTEHRIAPQT